MTVWRDYACWKSSWLSNIPAELDTSRTQDELIANEYRTREDFETNPQQLLALHPLARALYRGTCVCMPFAFGGMTISFLVARARVLGNPEHQSMS